MKITIWEKLFGASVVAIAVLNPLSGQYVSFGVNFVLDLIVQGINYGLDMLAIYGIYVISVPIVYVVAYVVYKMRGNVKLPSKSKKTSKNGMKYESI